MRNPHRQAWQLRMCRGTPRREAARTRSLLERTRNDPPRPAVDPPAEGSACAVGGVRGHLRGDRARNHRQALADHDLRARHGVHPRGGPGQRGVRPEHARADPAHRTAAAARCAGSGAGEGAHQPQRRPHPLRLGRRRGRQRAASLEDGGDDRRFGRALRGRDGRPRAVGPQPGDRRPRELARARSYQRSADARPGDRGRGAAHRARRHPARAADPVPRAVARPARAARRADHDRLRRGDRLRGLRRDAAGGEAVRDRRHRRGARVRNGACARHRAFPDDPHSLPKRGSRSHRVSDTRPRSPRQPPWAAPGARF